MENLENKLEQQKLNINEAENGDVFFISGASEDELVKVAISICQNLDKSILPRDLKKEYFLEGEAIRPGGCFSVRYDKNKKQLFIDNRNARGDSKYTEKLKQAVYSAIDKYNKE